jgi:hypothetical protein
MADVRLDHAIEEPHDAAGVQGDVFFVGDEDDRLAIRIQSIEERKNLLGRDGIEVAGRFIGQDVLRIVREAARDAGALLLAAGKLRRPMIEAMSEPDERGKVAAVSAALGRDVALVIERRLDVFLHRELRDQVVGLEDEADARGSDGGELVVVERGDIILTEEETPACRLIEAAEQIEQSTLAGAGRSHDGDVVALRDVEVDAFQHRDGLIAEFIRLEKSFQPNCRAHRRSGDAVVGRRGRHGRFRLER